MGLLGLFSNKSKNDKAKDREIAYLRKENRRLKKLCHEKDSFFTEMISDGLRHGSSLAGKHMSDRKKYLNGK
ncbi:MAG: hypothetical protein E7191_05480 [Erysipelotrichaceae bacterium]|nr:hypothetical protein [Erysipelotrichaceae bacterium]